MKKLLCIAAMALTLVYCNTPQPATTTTDNTGTAPTTTTTTTDTTRKTDSLQLHP